MLILNIIFVIYLDSYRA